MAKRLNQAMLAALADIEEANRALAALEFFGRFLTSDYGYDRDREVREAFTVLHSRVYRRNLRAYEHLMKVGVFIDDPGVRAQLRKIIYDRHFSSPMAIMWLTDPRGEEPSIYSSEDERALRRELLESLEVGP